MFCDSPVQSSYFAPKYEQTKYHTLSFPIDTTDEHYKGRVLITSSHRFYIIISQKAKATISDSVRIMPKKFFKRFVPSAQDIKEKKAYRFLGKWLHHGALWHFNRRSVAGAFAIGLFFAWFPIPSQIVYASIVAVYCRVNLPIAAGLIWLTNPITIPPLFYFAYRMGCFLLGEDAAIQGFEMSMEWLADSFGQIWLPLVVGSLSLGVISGIIGYFTVHLLWRLHTILRWRKRANRHH